MFDARDGTLEERKAEQPIGSTLCMRVERRERLDTNKEREQAASDFRFHGGGQMFSGWIKSKSTDPSRTDAFLFRDYERFLCPVAIDNQQGYPFFVVKDGGESLGQAAFANASLLRGEAQIDGAFGCVLRHIYKV